jgi:hypothetical protein
MCIVGVLDIALVLHWNREIGISDELTAIGGDVVQEAISFTFKSMPFLVLAAKLCPEGVEASLFSLFMSVNNLGFIISMLYGAGLMYAFGVNKDDTSQFYLLLMIKSVSRLAAVPFVALIPDMFDIKDDDEYLELEVLK